jgi:hypothetical protein
MTLTVKRPLGFDLPLRQFPIRQSIWRRTKSFAHAASAWSNGADSAPLINQRMHPQTLRRRQKSNWNHNHKSCHASRRPFRNGKQQRLLHPHQRPLNVNFSECKIDIIVGKPLVLKPLKPNGKRVTKPSAFSQINAAATTENDVEEADDKDAQAGRKRRLIRPDEMDVDDGPRGADDHGVDALDSYMQQVQTAVLADSAQNGHKESDKMLMDIDEMGSDDDNAPANEDDLLTF